MATFGEERAGYGCHHSLNRAVIVPSMLRVLIFINLAGGLIALIASSVTPTPSAVTFPTRTTYILGTFQLNAMHGLMHLGIGVFGLWALNRLESCYCVRHTVWFLLIGSWGLHSFPSLAPEHTAAGLAINPCRTISPTSSWRSSVLHRS